MPSVIWSTAEVVPTFNPFFPRTSSKKTTGIKFSHYYSHIIPREITERNILGEKSLTTSLKNRVNIDNIYTCSKAGFL